MMANLSIMSRVVLKHQYAFVEILTGILQGPRLLLLLSFLPNLR